jgi:hypothetical protein
VYGSARGVLTFPVPYKNGRKFVSFDTTPNELVVDDPELQEGIEESAYFKEKRILLLGSTLDGKKGEKESAVDFDPVEYGEVTDINMAAEILRGNPYRIHHSKLKSPESILKEAEGVNASFPNLRID